MNDHLFGKELFIRFTASAFRKLPSIYVFSYFPFAFEGRIWDLIVSVPDHCLSFYFPSDIVKSVIGCRPISSRLMTVRLRASPFNITIIQIYAPTSSYDDSDVDEFYRELQSLADQTPKQDILVVQGDWNAKVGEDAQEDWGEVCGPSCNPETNDRGLKLLDFAIYNNLVLANTLCNHKPSRR